MGDNAVLWIAGILTLAVTIAIDKSSQPGQWHAAIVWTGCACLGVVLFGRSRWRSWRFWLLGTVFLTLHVFAMWLIFHKSFPASRVLGALFLICPLALAEAVLALGLIVRLELGLARIAVRRE